LCLGSLAKRLLCLQYKEKTQFYI